MGLWAAEAEALTLIRMFKISPHKDQEVDKSAAAKIDPFDGSFERLVKAYLAKEGQLFEILVTPRQRASD
jgi:hypothetical protein